MSQRLWVDRHEALAFRFIPKPCVMSDLLPGAGPTMKDKNQWQFGLRGLLGNLQPKTSIFSQGLHGMTVKTGLEEVGWVWFQPSRSNATVGKFPYLPEQEEGPLTRKFPSNFAPHSYHAQMNSQGTVSLTPTQWLVCIIASIGFAFDIYELLMLPLIIKPAIESLG